MMEAQRLASLQQAEQQAAIQTRGVHGQQGR